MGKKSKFLIIPAIALSLLFGTGALSAHAQTTGEQKDYYNVGESPQVNLNTDDTLYPVEQTSTGKFSPKELSPIYSYKITSKTVSGYAYGGWRQGPSGWGISHLTLNNSTATSISFQTSISGSYPIGKGQIGSSLGVTIGKTSQYGTSYSYDIPKGEHAQIIYRSHYKIIKVVQREYINGFASQTYKTAYVHVFVNWDYNHKKLN